MSRRVAVCSWSLQPDSARDLADKVRRAGLDAVQLALDPIRTGAMPAADVRQELSGITIVSGMMAMAGEDYSTLASIRETGGVVPDSTWPANLAAARENAAIARSLGIGLVTFHAGFVPHGPDDARRSTLVARLRRLAETFAQADVRIALETGQETAETMDALIGDLAANEVGVNFDPANMILYGMGEPVHALARLASHVRQVHIKDAVAAQRAGEWGREVPVGEGEVEWRGIFATLRARGVVGDLVIEREAGDARVDDVRQALALVRAATTD